MEAEKEERTKMREQEKEETHSKDAGWEVRSEKEGTGGQEWRKGDGERGRQKSRS